MASSTLSSSSLEKNLRLPAFSPSQIASTVKVRDPKVSPAGRYVLYQVQSFYKSERSVLELWLAHAAETASARKFADDARAGVWKDEETAVWLGKAGSVCMSRVGADREKPHIIAEGGAKNFEISPDGEYLAFLEEKKTDLEDPKVFGRVASSSSLKIYHFATRVITELHPVHRVESFSWSVDSRSLLYRSKLGEEGPVSLYLLSILDDSKAEVEVEKYARPPSGPTISLPSGHILSLQNYEPNRPVDARTLFVRHVSSVKKMYGVKEDAIRIVSLAPNVSVLAVEVAYDVHTRIDVVTFSASSPPTTFTLYDTGEREEAIWFGAWDARLVDDGEYVFAAVLSSGPKHEAPHVYSVRLGKERTRVSPSHISYLESAPGLTARVIRWKAKDGVLLNGMVRGPPGWDGKERLPVVLFIHGGPYRRDVPDYMPYFCNWRELFAGAGFLVISTNYRGSQGRGHTFASSASLRQSWSDCSSMLDEVIRLGWADPRRMGVAGWSHGGSLTAYGIAFESSRKRGKRFNAAIVGAGVSNWEGMVLEAGMPGLEAALGGKSLPWDKQPLLARLLSMSLVSKSKSPVHLIRPRPSSPTRVLIFHGEKDQRVPLNQALAFHRILQKTQGWEVEMVVYPREPHGFTEKGHAKDVLERALGFVRQFV